MNPDQVNSFFAFMGCFFVLLNIRKLYKDQEVKGINPFSPLFFYTGQVWGVYFFYTLHQWWSFSGALALVTLSIYWYVLMLYYNYVKAKIRKLF